MPYFVLTSLKGVETALDLLSSAHGAYSAVDILKKALSDVDEPKDLDAQLQKSELRRFASYEGPSDADRTVLKAVMTAANSAKEEQGPLLELVALVVTRLGVAQGSKVLSLLLVASGFDPTLAIVVIKLCLVLARTEIGKKIVAAAGPQLSEAIGASADRSRLAKPLEQLAKSMGDGGADLLNAAKSSADLARRTARAGADAIDGLLDSLDGTSPDERKN